MTKITKFLAKLFNFYQLVKKNIGRTGFSKILKFLKFEVHNQCVKQIEQLLSSLFHFEWLKVTIFLF